MIIDADMVLTMSATLLKYLHVNPHNPFEAGDILFPCLR